jgi:hypothetical protein
MGLKVRKDRSKWKKVELVRITWPQGSFVVVLFICFSGIAVWTQGFTLAKQVLYFLNYTSSPFYSGYFRDGGLMNYLPGLALNLDPPDLSLPSSKDYRSEPPAPGCFLFFDTGD